MRGERRKLEEGEEERRGEGSRSEQRGRERKGRVNTASEKVLRDRMTKEGQSTWRAQPKRVIERTCLLQKGRIGGWEQMKVGWVKWANGDKLSRAGHLETGFLHAL